MDNIKTISDLMRYCHISQKFVVDIRNMKDGDIFFVGRYKVNNLNVSAYICKMTEKRYAFNGAYTNLDKMSIHVERDNLKGIAHFIFGCGEFVSYCMYDYSRSLKCFINETLALMEALATEIYERKYIRKDIE
ncbi:hypothetical protein H3S74_12295 [Gilliamella sp. W8126]|uniref:hypothetical protein n=1 Tax=Gilliamella sp. W8126 TaxID=2750946 RepID=UPI0018DCA4CC|nr:hypothetical protein [Gilliamella sp. W8126]MBI0007010.1 hypothetical protein [Gilliamella sp. W8126]